MFKIRDMVLDDIAHLQTILQSTPSDWTISILKDCFVDHYFRWVIADKNTLVGFIVVKNNIDTWEILQLVVGKHYQRQGLGKQLLAYALKQAKKCGIEKMQLEVRRSNVIAIALYQHAGFHEVGVRKRYYPDFEDAVLMDKLLSLGKL